MNADADRLIRLHEAYGIIFPEDLFRFSEFIADLSIEKSFDGLELLGMRLAGPLSVLAGLSPEISASEWYLQERYYDDPPEFVTVMTGDTDGLHWGYWFDDPDNSPKFCVASFFASDAFEFSINGDNLFEATRDQLEGCYMTTLEYLEDDDENADEYRDNLVHYDRIREQLIRCATGDRKEVGEVYLDLYDGSAREELVVADTSEHMGIVVPTSSYRPLSVSDERIWKRARENDHIEALVDEARQSVADSCPGTALKLGRDLWGGDASQKNYSYELLSAAYQGLKRPTLEGFLNRIIASRR